MMRSVGSPTEAYAANGFAPQLVADFIREKYFVNAVATTFAGMIDYTGGLPTMADSDGVLKWSPHNLVPASVLFNRTYTGGNDFNGLNANLVPGAQYTARCTVGAGDVYTGSVIFVTGFSDIGTTSATIADADQDNLITLTFTVGSDTSGGIKFGTREDDGNSVTISDAHIYRSDLGGMVNNPDTGDSYVPTTTAARYLPRRGNHKWNGTAWVNAGLKIESAQATNLLLNTATLATQSKTVTAVPHTLHFTGTGTVTLTGASTAGPLVGTGTGEENRVSLTFTPTAGSLTLTVSGTVSAAQLEVGSVPSSYIPTNASAATRIAQTTSIAGAKMPAYTASVSLAIKGAITYADTGANLQARYFDWAASGSDKIQVYLSNLDANTGQILFNQISASVNDVVISAQDAYAPGINVPFNLASRNGSTFINGAVEGTALAANNTPVALPDLSSAPFKLVTNGIMNIGQVLAWPEDIGDTGIEEASA